MQQKHMTNKKIMQLSTFLIFSTLIFSSAVVSSTDSVLPPPSDLDMILEESIMRRMSIREFTDEQITDEELATILWAAHGYRDDGKRTIPGISEIFSSIIYVLKEDAAYIYDSANHSLVFYKEGDWRDIVGWQYEAPIQLGLCWNTDISDINNGAAEIAQMCMNIYLAANALNLGTVACGQYPPAIEPLGIPNNHDGIIVMPIGHPLYPYNFQYQPRLIPLLPKIQFSEITLTEALKNRVETSVFTGELTPQQESQLLWAGYGYSYYVDKSDNSIGRLDRHRSIPSAHGYYPNDLYLVKESGIYRYYSNFYNPVYGILKGMWFLPLIPFSIQISKGDYRAEIAQASQNADIASSPFIVIPVLDDAKANRWDDLSGEQWRWLWIFDASSSANNILLEATAQDLFGQIVLINNDETIISLLNLQDDQHPLLLIALSIEH